MTKECGDPDEAVGWQSHVCCVFDIFVCDKVLAPEKNCTENHGSLKTVALFLFVPQVNLLYLCFPLKNNN